MAVEIEPMTVKNVDDWWAIDNPRASEQFDAILAEAAKCLSNAGVIVRAVDTRDKVDPFTGVRLDTDTVKLLATFLTALDESSDAFETLYDALIEDPVDAAIQLIRHRIADEKGDVTDELLYHALFQRGMEQMREKGFFEKPKTDELTEAEQREIFVRYGQRVTSREEADTLGLIYDPSRVKHIHVKAAGDAWRISEPKVVDLDAETLDAMTANAAVDRMVARDGMAEADDAAKGGEQ